MARAKKSNWQENYAGLILGAIIVIIVGLLVANFLTKKNEQIDTGEQVTKEEQMTVSEYKVEKGDSLSKIAEKTYQDLELWPAIAKVNEITNPNIIFTGSVLKLPPKEELETVRKQLTQTSYEVKEGDTLFIIAEKMYGDGSKWSTIARVNKVGTLANGNPLIFAGSTLKIPR